MTLPVQSLSSQPWTDADQKFMRLALDLARKAEAAGEIPVGAVLVSDDRVVGEGWNRPISSNDPTAHAEIEALRAAAAQLRNYRLPGTALYVTLEPCVMCAGALVMARVERLVFAARDLRFGGVRSKFQLADCPVLNHQLHVEEGLMSSAAAEILAAFLQKKRKK